MPSRTIYLDYHATTPLAPEVLDAMLPYLKESYGNPSSRTHAWGFKSAEAVERARGQIARLIGAEDKEIIFTSGATESNNLCLKGVVGGISKARLVTSDNEHPSILQVCRYLESKGHAVHYLPVDTFGCLDLQAITRSFSDSPSLVSIMLANHEVGTVNPIAEIGQLCTLHKIPFHVDASQGAGLLPINVEEWHIDFLSLSAHKMYGPKGIGALYKRKGSHLTPLLHGGGQERGLRAGTLNVPGIVGFGKAAEIALRTKEKESKRLETLRNRLWNQLNQHIEGIRLLGHPMKRLPDHLSVSFSGIDAEELMLEMSDLALSSGSACSAGSGTPSYILKNMQIADEFIHGSIRIGVGRITTEEDIDYAGWKIAATVSRLNEKAENRP